MRRGLIYYGALFLVGVLLVLGTEFATRHSSNSSSTSCQTFARQAQPGLFETFQGKVCTTSPGVKRIARQYNLCVKETGSTPQCGWDLLGFFASSGAYPDDAAKAELLVLRAASGR